MFSCFPTAGAPHCRSPGRNSRLGTCEFPPPEQVNGTCGTMRRTNGWTAQFSMLQYAHFMRFHSQFSSWEGWGCFRRKASNTLKEIVWDPRYPHREGCQWKTEWLELCSHFSAVWLSLRAWQSAIIRLAVRHPSQHFCVSLFCRPHIFFWMLYSQQQNPSCLDLCWCSPVENFLCSLHSLHLGRYIVWVFPDPVWPGRKKSKTLRVTVWHGRRWYHTGWQTISKNGGIISFKGFVLTKVEAFYQSSSRCLENDLEHFGFSPHFELQGSQEMSNHKCKPVSSSGMPSLMHAMRDGRDACATMKFQWIFWNFVPARFRACQKPAAVLSQRQRPQLQNQSQKPLHNESRLCR